MFELEDLSIDGVAIVVGGQRKSQGRGAISPLGRILEPAFVPPGPGPSQEPGPPGSDVFVDGGDLAASFVFVDQPNSCWSRSEAMQRRECARDLEVDSVGGDPVTEATVDGGLGGPQGGQRLAPIGDVVEVGTHHLAKDPLSAMGGSHRHHGRSAGFDDAARDRQLEREGTRGTDHLGAVPGAEGAVPLPDAVERLGRVWPGVDAEVSCEDETERLDLIGRRDSDVDSARPHAHAAVIAA
jgi:hypothetical protein